MFSIEYNSIHYRQLPKDTNHVLATSVIPAAYTVLARSQHPVRARGMSERRQAGREEGGRGFQDQGESLSDRGLYSKSQHIHSVNDSEPQAMSIKLIKLEILLYNLNT